MALEEDREVEQGLVQHAGFDQDQRNQQATDAAVAIHERMDSFELHVGEGGLDDRCRGAVHVVEKAFQGGKAVVELTWRGQHELGLVCAMAPDPHLVAAELAGAALHAAPRGHQGFMHFANQPPAERQTLAQAPHAEVERVHVAGDFLHVVHRHTGQGIHLEEHQVRERRLGPFDLRGHDGFLADVRTSSVGKAYALIG